MSMDVTVVGDVNIDLLTPPIENYPKKGSQLRIPWVKMEVGGGAANFAFAASKLGLKTKVIGLTGNDTFGDFIDQKLKNFGIENKIRRIDKETGVSIGISFRDGSKSLITFRGTNLLFSIKDFNIREIEGRVLHVGGYNLLENFQKDLKRVLNYAKSKNMITCLDPDLKSGINCDLAELKSNLKFVDFFFPDFEEGKILTKEKDEIKVVKKILRFGCKVVALKLGKGGCLVADKKNIFKIEGIKTSVLNSVGAGDFFNAGFVFGYLKYKKLEKAGMFGNATAVFSLTRFGNERYATEKDVERLVKNEYKC